MGSTTPLRPSTPSLALDGATLRRLNATLLAYARRRVRPDEAEDVVQATWAAALLGAHDGRGSFEAFLVSILRRRIIDRYRERRRSSPLVFEPAAPCREREASERRAELARVASDWHHLPPREARALELLTIEEHDHDEAAAELGVSRVHLRVLVHRARERLRESRRRSDDVR